MNSSVAPKAHIGTKKAMAIAVGFITIGFATLHYTGLLEKAQQKLEQGRQAAIEEDEIRAELQEARNFRVVYTVGSPVWYPIAEPAERKDYFQNLCEHTYGILPDSRTFLTCIGKEEQILRLEAHLYHIEATK